jgi:hypothetical protein
LDLRLTPPGDSAGGVEQLDEIARGIDEEHLGTAGSGHDADPACESSVNPKWAVEKATAASTSSTM